MGQGRWRQERARLLAFDVQADIVPAPRERGTMQQQISIITLGIDDLPRSRRFYTEGFGWAPVFENAEILFYQMNGLVLGTWLRTALAADMGRAGAPGPGSIALAHNVASAEEVRGLIARLAQAGGTILREGDAPPHGGFRGYVADPDGHAWEIAWNPAWPIDAEGHVTFAL
jgi:catechol 2,3-dioxygenase-like lactoylglutathione lyase family enzyme